MFSILFRVGRNERGLRLTPNCFLDFWSYWHRTKLETTTAIQWMDWLVHTYLFFKFSRRKVKEKITALKQTLAKTNFQENQLQNNQHGIDGGDESRIKWRRGDAIGNACPFSQHRWTAVTARDGVRCGRACRWSGCTTQRIWLWLAETDEGEVKVTCVFWEMVEKITAAQCLGGLGKEKNDNDTDKHILSKHPFSVAYPKHLVTLPVPFIIVCSFTAGHCKHTNQFSLLRNQSCWRFLLESLEYARMQLWMLYKSVCFPHFYLLTSFSFIFSKILYSCTVACIIL